MPNSSNIVDDYVEYITGAYCPLPSFGNESEFEVEYITGAYCPLPGYENESKFVSESLSEEFNEALIPWVDRIFTSGGAVIGKTRPDVRDIRFGSSISGRQKRVKRPVGKTPGVSFKQAGFFDLGISLLILAISGTSVYFIEKGPAETSVSAQQNIEITATRPAENSIEKIASLSPHGSALSIQ